MVLAHTVDAIQRTEDIKICQDTTFDTMMLSPNILSGLKDSGFIKPSPIQLLGIPLGKVGLDLLLEAKSGTGKTVVFSTVALEKLNFNKGLQVIIITPTREIAVQICDVLKQIGSKYEGLSVEVVIGGLSYQDDITKMKKNVHILVGTPGRLKYLIQDKHVETNAIRLLILDEADKLTEISFQSDIKYIHSALPKQKQVIMSSATYPESVMDVINKLVKDPQHVCPNRSNVLLGVSHRVIYVKYNCNSIRQTELRYEEVIKILKETQFKQCVIFCNYQARVSQLHKMLTKARWPADLVYGKQDQTLRLDALKTLQEYKCRILISTDLVSRGIDAKNVDLVINFEPPDSCETYLHRIGRSGRYGSIGMAVSIVSEGAEQRKFDQMLEPIANSISLQQFWTGEHISYFINETKLAEDIDVNNQLSISKCNFEQSDNYDKLWNFILGDTKESNNIESFDQLCLSFNGPNKSEKIESFSDLLRSYQNLDQNKIKENTEYKQMKFDNISCMKYINAVRNLKLKFEISTNINNGINGNCDCSLNSTLQNNKENKITSTVKSEEESNLIINYDLNNSNNNIQKDLDSKNNLISRNAEKNYTDANDFISQLPTSTSFCGSTSKVQHQTCYETKYQDIQTNGVSCDVLHKGNKVQSKTKPLMKRNQTDKFNISLSSSHNHNQDELHHKEKSEGEVYISSDSNVNPNVINNKSSHSVYSDYDYGKNYLNYDEHISRNKSYYQWYNQLKTNMKQIEQFLYIEEISKP